MDSYWTFEKREFASKPKAESSWPRLTSNSFEHKSAIFPLFFSTRVNYFEKKKKKKKIDISRSSCWCKLLIFCLLKRVPLKTAQRFGEDFSLFQIRHTIHHQRIIWAKIASISTMSSNFNISLSLFENHWYKHIRKSCNTDDKADTCRHK